MTRRLPVTRVATAVLLMLLVLTGGALARTKTRVRHAKHAAKTTAAARAAKAKAKTKPVAAPAPPRSMRFTLEFVGADVSDVFQALATQSGVNIATSGSVTGKTTLRLHNVTLGQAMNIVTKMNGLDYAWVDAAYVVGTPEEIRTMKVAELRTAVVVLRHIPSEYVQEAVSKVVPDVTVSGQKGVRSVLLLGPESSLAKAEQVVTQIDVPTPPTTEVLPVRYVKAEKVSQMITQAVPDCTVQPGPQDNSLLITANSQQWQTIRTLASQVDAAPAAAQATEAIYTVKYTSPQELQEALTKLLPDLQVTLAPRSYTPALQKPTGGSQDTLSLLAAPQLATSGGGGAAGGKSGTEGIQMEAAPVTSLILSGSPVAVERGMALLAQLDKAPRQVRINAMVTEVNRGDITRLGIDWTNLGTGAPFTIGEPLESEIDPKTGLPKEPDPKVMRNLNVGKIMRTPIQTITFLHALQEQNKLRVLSNPTVTVLDGRQTTLHAGDTILYPVVISASTTGGVITDTRELQTGITLTVNPRVNENGEVTLTLAPTVSELSTISFGGLPSVNERGVVTVVRVKSGETAVLAGLISDEDRVTVSKVPFLGNVPILGELFKYRDRRPTHTEIMIFVTPTIVEG